jgi:WD40 repeat protein
MGIVEVGIGHGRRTGKFRVDVVRSPAGEASAEVSLDADRLLAGRTQFEQTLLVSGIAARPILTSGERAVRETGQALFSALLGVGDVAGRYRASAALAEERGEELRIVLRLGVAELAALPWEAMYDPVAGGYVCRQHQLVRHVPVAAAPLPLAVSLPLRILAVVSAPRGLPALDVDREREQLTQALAGLAGQGLAELIWAPSATWDGLHKLLLAGPWHVLHFIGHGDFDVDRDEGMLALAREDGRADLVEASRFASLLRQARPMPRLLVLNSCSGAATGAGDLFSGTAAALARSGVPAVTAMQYSISDAAAVAFARGFYATLAHGRAVDDAVSAGRIAILGISGQTLEWITPTIYLRGQDARLFNLPTAGNPLRTPQQAAGATPAHASAAPVLSRLRRNLTGHTDYVNRVAFSPDSTLLATASSDKTARLWDVTTGQTTRILTGHTDYLFGVAFSPDGNLLATASHDASARLWDVVTGQTVGTLTGHKRYVFAVAFSPDGALLATAGEDATVRLWDVVTGQTLQILTGHKVSVYDVAFSPDGVLLATSSGDGKARLWDVQNGETTFTLVGHKREIHGVAFSPDGMVLATGSGDGTTRLWDVATGQTTIRISTGSAVAFSPDGTLLATGGNYGKTSLWDVATGQAVRTLTGHTDIVRSAAFSPDGTLLATGSYDKTARLWA